MKVNTYGLVMNGLRKAAGETKELTDCYSDRYVQISYNRDTGDILTHYHVSLGENSWVDYHDHNIIAVCNASSPMTMQDIADTIHKSVVSMETIR